jgi:hypothetical protein
LQLKVQVAPLHPTTPFVGADGHVPHAPPQQTWPMLPHDVRSGALPVAVQTDCPVVQLVVPVWQTLLTEHAAPPVQAVHVPALQTSLDPHPVPLATFVPVSMHVAVPMAHARTPVWQALVGVHTAPAVQEPHAPLLQT